MSNPKLKQVVKEFVEINGLYKYVDPIRAETLMCAMPYLAAICQTDLQTLDSLIRDEILRQRELRGLCRRCADKTVQQDPNLCIQCAMQEYNEDAEIPRYYWLSPQ